MVLFRSWSCSLRGGVSSGMGFVLAGQASFVLSKPLETIAKTFRPLSAYLKSSEALKQGQAPPLVWPRSPRDATTLLQPVRPLTPREADGSSKFAGSRGNSSAACKSSKTAGTLEMETALLRQDRAVIRLSPCSTSDSSSDSH